MGTIAELADNMRALDFAAVVQESIQLTDTAMIELQQKQMMSGIDSQGRRMRYPYAWDWYTKWKLKKNPLGVRDLKGATGAFYRGMNVRVSRSEFEIGSTDSKTEEILNREESNGSDPFGLTPDNTGNYAQDAVLPEIQRMIEEKTGLKFE